MGQEIVYCFKCQRRIVGAEYAKGLAYQVGNQICCSTCVVLVLDTLPPKAKEELLAKMFKATQERQSSSSGAVKSLPGQSPGSSTRRIPTTTGQLSDYPSRAGAGESSSTPIIVGVGVAVLALILAALALSGGSSSPAPAPVNTIKRPPPPPPPDAGPSPEEKRRAESAKEAMRKARDFAQANAKDLEGQARQWRTALLEAERTGFEAEARRELERAETRVKEAAAQELADLERQIRAPLGRKEFKAAQDLLDQARPRRSTLEWSSLIDRLQREVQETAARSFAVLKEKAVAARDRGAKADIDAAKAEITRWGLPNYVTELETALTQGWRPIFDGKTTSFLAPDSVKAWKVVDGVLIYTDVTVRDAGQTREEFGDGEFRFRFTIERSSQFYFGVRQGGAGTCRAVFRKTETIGSGEHEIVFSCRGSQVSAAFDGNPVPLEMPKEVNPRGHLQFRSADGIFRVLAVEFRPLP